MSLIDRTVFIAPVVGEATRAAITADVGLAVRRRDGVVDRADMLLFSMYALRGRGYSSRLASLLSATIAQVAVFDPEVVLRLAEERPERILAPTDVLVDLAKERRWEPGTPRDWALGTSSVVEGHGEPHAALDALGVVTCDYPRRGPESSRASEGGRLNRTHGVPASATVLSVSACREATLKSAAPSPNHVSTKKRR